jgi:hypothetical protein
MTGIGRGRGWFSSERGFALVLLSAFVFYLPFLPRSFVGDDWLWLAHGARAAADPGLFLTRPIYGYFRPLFAAYVAIIHAVSGLNVYVYGVLIAGIHTGNGFLLYRMLRRLQVDADAARIAAVLFSFYFLNCAAVCWISAGADVLVLTLLLVFSTMLIDFYARPSALRFIALLAVALCAVMIKETGFACAVLFLAYPLLERSNPFSARAVRFTATFILVFAIYAIMYFQSRTVIDKEVILNARTPLNLWFLFVYLFMPLPERFVALLGEGLKQLLAAAKASFALALPAVWGYAFVRRSAGERFALLWPCVMLIPVSLFDWNVSIFDLYPSRTASRFMYVATPGFGAFAGLLLGALLKKHPNTKRYTVLALIVFVGVNSVAVKGVTELYRQRESEDASVFQTLSEGREMIRRYDTLVVDRIRPPACVDTPSGFDVIKSMVYLATGADVHVRYATIKEGSAGNSGNGNASVLAWDENTGRYVVRDR